MIEIPYTDLSPFERAVVLLSGGLDSTVLLAWARRRVKYTEAVSVDYGAHALNHAEMVAAEKVAYALGSPRIKVFFPPIFGPSALTTGYGSPVVPGRNAVLIATGIARAAALGGGVVLIGCTAEDQLQFPDCRPDFINAARQFAELATEGAVSVRAPFVPLHKSDVVRLGVSLKAPLEITHTCYLGARPACGECLACRTRLAGFEAAGMADPISYARAA